MALTARGLRGIHGHDADLLVSLAQRSRVNVVIRASTLLAEVAASHATDTRGMRVGEMDHDELSAIALHHFGCCELVPSLAGDRSTPKLIVSPTGDLLYDHSFGDDTLAPSAAAMHAEQRLRHIDDYGWWLARKPRAQTGLERDLVAAREAGYGVSPHCVRRVQLRPMRSCGGSRPRRSAVAALGTHRAPARENGYR